MISHIFSDLDGTLLNEYSQVSQETIKTITEVNIPISLLSARTPNDMDPIVKAIHSSAPQVAFNGALIYQNIGEKRAILSEKPLDWNTAKKLSLLFSYISHILGLAFMMQTIGTLVAWMKASK